MTHRSRLCAVPGVTPDATKPKMKAQLREIMRDLKMQHPLAAHTPRKGFGAGDMHSPIASSSSSFMRTSSFGSTGLGESNRFLSDGRQAFNQNRVSFTSSVGTVEAQQQQHQHQQLQLQEDDEQTQKQRNKTEKKAIKKIRKQSILRLSQTNKLLDTLFSGPLSDQDWEYGLYGEISSLSLSFA